jgi:hypothetical protein
VPLHYYIRVWKVGNAVQYLLSGIDVTHQAVGHSSEASVEFHTVVSSWLSSQMWNSSQRSIVRRCNRTWTQVAH